MKIDKKLIEELKNYLEEFGLSEIEYQDGNKKIKVAKNKLAPPFRIAEVDLIYGVGISRMGVLIDLALNEDIVQKSGTWFSYNNERLYDHEVQSLGEQVS